MDFYWFFLEMNVRDGPQDESSLPLPHDEERLSRAAVASTSSAEGKFVYTFI